MEPDIQHGAPPADFPLQPVALKIIADGVLAATLLRAGDLEPDRAMAVVLLTLLAGVAISSAAAIQMVRAGHGRLWDITTVACLAAMGVIVTLHGALIFGVLLGGFAYWRWRRILDGDVTGASK